LGRVSQRFPKTDARPFPGGATDLGPCLTPDRPNPFPGFAPRNNNPLLPQLPRRPGPPLTPHRLKRQAASETNNAASKAPLGRSSAGGAREAAVGVGSRNKLALSQTLSLLVVSCSKKPPDCFGAAGWHVASPGPEWFAQIRLITNAQTGRSANSTLDWSRAPTNKTCSAECSPVISTGPTPTPANVSK